MKNNKYYNQQKKKKKKNQDGCLDGCSEGCCSTDGCLPLILLPVQIGVLGYWIIEKLI
ncbi:hypothetical protein GKZ89_09875 [Bacillus mangrovi]|uniref:Uncharacterized protein n=1 Tax=Metabacillus mangrovi TaxID=1491830 RepID=A0A7X2S5Q3_9BACI|nr:hypothetical protein [Metabacillus mangrovi]MTH53711.1 hypothetical protein [Metabacillus mangrovi]